MRNRDECSEEIFLKGVEDHVMDIRVDNGTYRHIVFRKPGTSCYMFELVTWPGCLCYTGDVGSWVFSRLTDMFEFFRGRNINPSYWASKIRAQDRSGTTEYSEEIFQEKVLDRLISHYDGEEDIPPDVMSEVESSLFGQDFGNAYPAMEAALSFQCGSFNLDDFWEEALEDYTYRYIWCCRALVWGIKMYDEATKESDHG